MANNILLGSGDLYIMEVTANTMPTDVALEVAGNKIGHISGGCVVEFKPTVSDVKNSYGEIVKRYVSEEVATLKTGILSFDMANIAKLVAGGTVTTDAGTGVKTLKCGGIKGLTDYAVHFVHEFESGDFLKVTLIGNALSGFGLNFENNKETVVDAEFSAIPMSDKALIVIREVPAV